MRSWQRISLLRFMAMFPMKSLRQSTQEKSPLSILPQHPLDTLGQSDLLKVGVLILPLFLLLSGCFWQELLCEVAMDNNSDIYQTQHDECRAINNPAIRGELLNR